MKTFLHFLEERVRDYKKEYRDYQGKPAQSMHLYDYIQLGESQYKNDLIFAVHYHHRSRPRL